jgi:hypothetical protein
VSAEPLAAAPATPAGAAAVPRRRFSLPALPAKYYSVTLITVILVVGQFTGGIVGGFEILATCLGLSMAAELLLGRYLRGAWPSLLSAYISGNSVAILTKPSGDVLWPYAAGALISITSKYVLTYRNRHLWNPTNFSFSVLLLLAPGSMSLLSHQWGNGIATWAVMAVGLLVVWRAKVLSITAAYVAAFALLAWPRSLLTGREWLTELGPLTGPMYMLLIFFMLTDPRTVVRSTRGRVTVVVLIAVLEALIRLLPQTDVRVLDPLLSAPAIFALSIIGPIAMCLDLRKADAR